MGRPSSSGTFIYDINGKQVIISTIENVVPPSPYSLFLAKHIPNLLGKTVADVGTGTGIQGIVAKLCGAEQVYLLDISQTAIDLSLYNAAQNGVEANMIPLCSNILESLPPGTKLDAIVCNPASQPMRPSNTDSPYYVGPEGRFMIERLIHEASVYLRPGGCLFMVHTSLADFPRSEKLMQHFGFRPFVVECLQLEFRSFYDHAWIDELEGLKRGLYTLKCGRPYEIVFMTAAEFTEKGS